MTVASRGAANAHAVQSGRAESRTLAEILAIDHGELLDHVLPAAPEALRAAVREAQPLGILARMQAIGVALHAQLGAEACTALTEHVSDTVRGWGWFALTAAPSAQAPADLIGLVLPAAHDPHFGVREWAWMTVRVPLAADLAASIPALAALTDHASERVRRFACETLRPRGVWAKHIPALKADPQLGEAILEPLRADPSRYVQDSVANWINDAAKTRPDWATALGERWTAESVETSTARIIRRGLRSL
ncbi:DNA alkylation repair protein [Microbacterium sp. KSW4-16]|uniref:DNA alkylation repair protein n=1 Tax=Microbacterium TaxID=33882 RepID=UPI00103B7B96|nr:MULTISPECIES: DNA alkylation repair protein [Microbacterium]MCK8465601.1 DNA alkylation repair protein [Microbacterium aurugineum]TCJ29299.1 DNA alkylation repair protein [Microbacterium sp. PI-1]